MDFSKLKLVELKEECRKRGLTVYGNKPILLERLIRLGSFFEESTEEENLFVLEEKKRKIDKDPSNPSKRPKHPRKKSISQPIQNDDWKNTPYITEETNEKFLETCGK
jgi:hypothetical protein